MVISCSTCQKEEKECTWVKYLIYTVLSLFKICRNLRDFFRQICIPKFQSSQKNVFFLVCIKVAPYFREDPLQNTNCVTGSSKESTACCLCLSRQVGQISRLEQFGLLGVPCHTNGSLQGVILVLRINRVVVVCMQRFSRKEQTCLRPDNKNNES